jgi:hypothetical protein
MKTIAVLFVCLAVVVISYAQNTFPFPATGNVGIGTTAPRSRLDLGGQLGAGQGARFGDYLEINEREYINNASSIGWNAYIAADDGSYRPLHAPGTGMVLAMESGGNANLDFWGKNWAGNASPQDLGTFIHVMRLSTNGNVGIGTTNPGEKLTVTNNVGNTITFGVRGAYPTVVTTGTNYYKQAEIGEPVYNIPVGIVDSGYRIGLAVQGYTYTSDFAGTLSTQMSLWVRAGSNTAAPTGTITNSYGIYLENLDGGVNIVNKYGLFQSNPTAKNYFAGNVGIGTTAPSHKLSVNGAIRAKEVIVDTGWSDYVFAKDYRLASLSEVEQHIQSQGHLPGIPSAQEVAEKGVSVGNMQSILLAKIEELTLHVIAQEKRLDQATAKIAVLEVENARLKN